MSSLIKWHKDKSTIYPKWEAEINGNIIATAVLSGRPGVDNYPWEWYTDSDTGVTDSLNAAKEKVEASLKANVTPKNCPLQNEWKDWSKEKRSDRIFMICPACGISGSHVRRL